MRDLSIIIVNYNTKKLLISCIKSILKSKPHLDYEVIVVDNGSYDNLVPALEALDNSRVKIIANRTNLGFAKAVNKGIKKAEGKSILLLNSDTEVKPRAIDRMFEFAKSNQNVGVVGGRLLNKDGSIQGSVYHFPSLINAIKEYWFGLKGSYEKYAPKENVPTKVDSVVMAAFLISPVAIRKAGLLNEKYFMYFEDLDYCRRVKEKSLDVYYLPEAEIYHIHGASGNNLVDSSSQWKRLIPSSIAYHGILKHDILTLILWLGQKWQNLLKKDRL